MSKLENIRVALLATDGFEDSELLQPLDRLREEHASVTIISDKEGPIEGKNGSLVDVDMLVDDAVAEDFESLVLPGGLKNPDLMRQNKTAVSFVRDFFEQGKPVSAICHAPWLLIEADVVDGRTVTSWPSLKTDLENAGAEWVDEEVVVDAGLTTSRNPDDLPAFCDKMVEEILEGKHADQTV